MLLVFATLLYRNAKNMRDVARQHGYKSLAVILKNKAHLLTEDILNVIFVLVEGKDPR